MFQTIESIHIKNSFAHKDTFIEFSKGRNYIIGSYGSGKSELIELLSFALFGTVALRGKATTYPDLEVTLIFNYLSDNYKIVRKINDANLYKLDDTYKLITTSTTGVNNKIISLIGYDYNIYLLSNYCQQGKLGYFSELTPAKRLQFIDKVSGIEEAKELLVWLNEKRKFHKTTVDTLEPLLSEPKLNPKIDLEADYKKMLSDLEIDFNKSNDISNSITIKKNSYKAIPKISKVPTSLQVAISKLSVEELETFKKDFKDYLDKIDLLEETEKELVSLRRKYNTPVRKVNLSSEEVNNYINILSVNSLSGVDVSCPHCFTSFSIDSLHKDCPYTLKDLTLELDWLSSETQSQVSLLEVSKNKYRNDVKTLLEQSLIVEAKDVYITYRQSLQGIQEAIEYVRIYQEYEEELANVTQFNSELTFQIKELEKELKNLLVSVKDITSLRTKYTTYDVQRNLYKEQLEIYVEHFKTFTDNKKDYELYLYLIAQATDIVNKIKQETVPLINHYASLYLSTITKGVMNRIEVTNNYDLLVDDISIHLKSGAQKDIASLAFRLSLGQSIILGMFPLFIGDEIDHSAGEGLTNDLSEALEKITENYQVILVTHKSPDNFSNYNIIDLG